MTPERGSDLFIRISNLSEAAPKTSHELNHLSQLASLLKCGILSPCELDRLLAPEYKSIFSPHPAVQDVCHVQQVHENPTAAEFEGWGWGRGEVCEKVFIPLSPFSFFYIFLFIFFLSVSFFLLFLSPIFLLYLTEKLLCVFILTFKWRFVFRKCVQSSKQEKNFVSISRIN